jgi:hypothetical protein
MSIFKQCPDCSIYLRLAKAGEGKKWGSVGGRRGAGSREVSKERENGKVNVVKSLL